MHLKLYNLLIVRYILTHSPFTMCLERDSISSLYSSVTSEPKRDEQLGVTCKPAIYQHTLYKIAYLFYVLVLNSTNFQLKSFQFYAPVPCCARGGWLRGLEDVRLTRVWGLCRVPEGVLRDQVGGWRERRVLGR